MAQPPRNVLMYDGCLFHVTWQCHNKEWRLKEDWTKRCYYDLLLRYRKDYSITFYGYHFMENHVHLVGKQETVRAFSDFFRTVHNLFARLVNRKNLQKGQMIMDRPKSPIIKDDRHLLVPAPSYLALSDDPNNRREEYRNMVKSMMRTHEALSIT